MIRYKVKLIKEALKMYQGDAPLDPKMQGIKEGLEFAIKVLEHKGTGDVSEEEK